MMISAYPRYNRYKDSGIDGIGDIPDHWEVQRNFALFRESKQAGRADLPVLSVSIHSGVSREQLSDEDNVRSIIKIEDRTAYKCVAPGDIAYNMMRAWQGGIGRVHVDGMVSPAYVVAKPNKGVCSSYLERQFRSPAYVSAMDAASKGITDFRKRLYWENFRSLGTILPPLPEQRAIAAFLDTKCATIDEAVRIKEEQIALLKERRQILIQQAVTRGLNPDAPMKDSGINWIGEIPAHWEVRRNFTLFKEMKNAGSAELPVLSVSIHSGVSREELSEDENIRSIIKIEDRSAYKEVLVGDIAYNMMRAWQGGIGAVHTHGMVSPAYVVARPVAALVADYFELLNRTPAFIRQMDASSKGITDFRKRLYWDDFRNCLTIVPSPEEQDKIIRYASEISGKIDNAISLKESQIAALKEYKTSLINAAVTGKIKVS